MGEILKDFTLKFNGSICLEAREERLTAEAIRGASRTRAPQGLASQPTLSRMVGRLAEEHNRRVLSEALPVRGAHHREPYWRLVLARPNG